jgi:hypothetical protein
MKLIVSAIGIASLTLVPLLAQESEVRTKQKTEVQKGERITATGCVRETAGGVMLTDVGGDATHSYLLVGKSDELAKYVGHRVEVKGKAADRKDGKVKTETKTKVGDKEQKTEVKSEGDVSMNVLGVDSVKTVPGGCR